MATRRDHYLKEGGREGGGGEYLKSKDRNKGRRGTRVSSRGRKGEGILGPKVWGPEDGEIDGGRGRGTGVTRRKIDIKKYMR